MDVTASMLELQTKPRNNPSSLTSLSSCSSMAAITATRKSFISYLFCSAHSSSTLTSQNQRIVNTSRICKASSLPLSRIVSQKSPIFHSLDTFRKVCRICTDSSGYSGPLFVVSGNREGMENATSSVEKLLNVESILKDVREEGNDFVFVDDGADGDSFPDLLERKSSLNLNPTSSIQVLPSASDMSKVLSAYHEAPPSLKEISVEELQVALRSPDPPILLDVRTKEEYAEMRVSEAINVPLPEVVTRVMDGSLSLEGRKIALICRSGRRSAQAATELNVAFNLSDLYNVAGGTLAWANKFPVDSDN